MAKSKKRKVKNTQLLGTIDKSVGNYEKHPFFVKKARKANALLNKVGLPDSVTSKHFTDKVIRDADRIWDKKGYNNDMMDEWLKDKSKGKSKK